MEVNIIHELKSSVPEDYPEKEPLATCGALTLTASHATDTFVVSLGDRINTHMRGTLGIESILEEMQEIAETEAKRLPMPDISGDNVVVITLSGGIAYLVKKPAGVAVHIHDYDIEDDEGDYIHRDENGDLVAVSVYE